MSFVSYLSMFFFFFKQKTAYEMRISDWSSDVCSSDLLDPVAIIVRYGKIGAAAMDAAPSLRVISKHGSGTDTIDKQAAQERGIEVVAALGANAAAVAEQALGLLLACAKSIVGLNARMHVVHWDKSTHKSTELGIG